MGTGGPWVGVEAMADNVHGFNVNKTVTKIGFHQVYKKMEVTWNLHKAAT